MKKLVLGGLALALLAAAGSSLLLGRYPLKADDLRAFVAQTWKRAPDPERAALVGNLLWNIRFPRLAAALLVGAALAASGAALQAIFINPLVSPKMLGLTAGTAFGAAAGMLLFKHWWMVQGVSVACGFAAVGFAVLVSRLYPGEPLLMLVLGGVVSETLFSALILTVQFVADPATQLPVIVYWLMGHLGMADRRTLLAVAGPMAAGIAALTLFGRPLNVLSMGDEEARSLGLRVGWVRAAVLLLTTCVCALSVMLAGLIGWVGLVIPHIARLLVGPDHTVLLPASALLGATYLILMDDVSRLLFRFEIPIGIVTALVGIPVFVLVLKNARRGWS